MDARGHYIARRRTTGIETVLRYCSPFMSAATVSGLTALPQSQTVRPKQLDDTYDRFLSFSRAE